MTVHTCSCAILLSIFKFGVAGDNVIVNAGNEDDHDSVNNSDHESIAGN